MAESHTATLMKLFGFSVPPYPHSLATVAPTMRRGRGRKGLPSRHDAQIELVPKPEPEGRAHVAPAGFAAEAKFLVPSSLAMCSMTSINAGSIGERRVRL